MKEHICGLAHVGMVVRDIMIAEKFYIDQLGFERGASRTICADEGNIEIVFLQKNNLVLECIQPHTYNEMHGDGVFVHIALDVTDIELLKEKLDSYGVKWIEELTVCEELHSKWMLFEGPNGEILEINEKF